MMQFQELIHEYMEGTLSDREQAELFHTISVSPEKRALFTDSTALRALAASDRVAESVPAAAEQAIFAAVAQSTAPRVPWYALTPRLAAAIAGLALTAGGVLGYLLHQMPDSVVPPSGDSRFGSSLTASAPPLPPSSARATPTVSLPLPERTRTVVRHDTVRVPSPEPPSNVADPFTVAVSAQTAPAQVSTAAAADSHAPIVPSVRPSGPAVALAQAPERASGLAAEVEILQGGTLAHTSIDASGLPGVPVLSAFRLRAGLRLSDAWSGGAYIGQTPFGLAYSDATTLVRRAYSQSSTPLIGGVYGRDALASLLSLTPRLTLGLGACSLGPSADADLSFAHPLSSTTDLLFGASWSGLAYRHAGLWFSSNTVCFEAGVGMHF